MVGQVMASTTTPAPPERLGHAGYQGFRPPALRHRHRHGSAGL